MQTVPDKLGIISARINYAVMNVPRVCAITEQFVHKYIINVTPKNGHAGMSVPFFC